MQKGNKMKTSIKILTVFVALLLVFALSVSADSLWEYEEYTHGETAGVAVTDYLGNEADVFVPAEIDGKPVLKIADGVFENNDTVNSITLSQNIKVIGEGAFCDADNLVCIVTNNALEIISANAFYGCDSFNSVILPDSVTDIAESAFAECNSLTIYCNENSVAHTHATANSIQCVILNADAIPEVYTVNGVEYYIMNGEAYAVSFDNSLSNVVIPATVEGCPVVELRSTFYDSTALVSVDLPNTLRKISDKAFYNCKNLLTVSVPESVTELGAYVFFNASSLTDIDLHNGIIKVGRELFYGCKSLKTIIIPKKLATIPYGMFYGCIALENIVIPEAVTEIGNVAFCDCDSMKEITIPATVKTFGGQILFSCDALEKVVLPDNMKVIPDAFFESCTSLKTVDLPESLEYLGYRAFYDCTGLETITIPEKVNTISYGTFFRCQSLTEVVLHENIKTIGECAFEGCSSLSSFVIPESVTSIEAYAFSDCESLTNIFLGYNLSYVSVDAFDSNVVFFVNEDSYAQRFCQDNSKTFCVYSPYTEFTFNNVTYRFEDGSVSVIGYDDEAAGYADEVEFLDTLAGFPVECIESSTFHYDHFAKVTVPKYTKIIRSYSFSYSESLKEVYLPEGLEKIESSAFIGCGALSSVVIPESVTTLYKDSFPAKTLWYVYEDSYAHQFAQENGILYFLADGELPELYTVGSLSYYIEDNCAIAYAFDGSTYSVTVPAEVYGYKVTSIGKVFSGSGVSYVTLPDTITRIGEGAFRDCKNLSNVTFSDTLTEIGDYAFSGSRLSYVTIPSSVKAIGKSAYSSCRYLRAVTFENGVETIGESAFANCYDVTKIVLPDSVKSIGNSAFSGCTRLSSVKLPSGITSVGKSTFYGCTSLSNISLPESVTHIGDTAFYNCNFKNDFVIPANVTNIGKMAFASCYAMETVTLSDKIETVYADSFPSNVVIQLYADTPAYDVITNSDLLYFVTDGTSAPDIRYIDGITYYVDSKEAIAINYKHTTSNIVMPETVGDCPVTELRYTFYMDSMSGVLTLPSSLKKIGSYAFYKTGISEVILPDTLTEIGESAFYDSEIKSITIPSAVTTIGDYAFSWCENLENLKIQEGVTTIGEYAFGSCTSLKSVVIPDSVVSIGESAFSSCYNLSNVVLPKNLKRIESYTFNSAFMYSENINLVIPEGVTYIGYSAFDGCDALTSIVIPNSVTEMQDDSFADSISFYVYDGSYAHQFLKENGNSFTVIKAGGTYDLFGYKFEISEDGEACIVGSYGIDTSVTELHIPATVGPYPVTTIGACAFDLYSLIHIYVPENVKVIESIAFYNCGNIKTVTLPESLTQMSTDSFREGVVFIVPKDSYALEFAVSNGRICIAVEEGETPEKYTVDGVEYYVANGEAVAMSYDMSSTSVVIPEKVDKYTVTSIGTAFANSSIVSISLPDTITSIPSRAFYFCSALTEINIPENVTSIGDNAFYYCTNISSIEIPDNVVSIGRYAFYDCDGLTELVIPDSVETVGSYAFAYLDALTSASLSSSVTAIPNGLFRGCKKLSEIVLPDTLKTIAYSAFDVCTALENVLIPKSVTKIETDSFPATTVLNVYSDSYAYTFAVENNLLYFVVDSGEVQETYIVDGVKYLIDNGEAIAVAYSGIATEVVIPSEIEGYPVTSTLGTFKENGTLKTVTLPSTLKRIGDGTFYNCRALKSVTIPDTLAEIGKDAFHNCYDLTAVNLPDTVNSIGEFAFSGCLQLTGINIPKALTVLPEYVFYDTSLKSVTIPENIIEIKAYAFAYTKLESIEIPDTVKTMGCGIFVDCYYLTDVTLPENITSIPSDTFSSCYSLKEIYLPESVEYIGSYAFNDCEALEWIFIPRKVSTIEWSTFEGCTSLKTVTIPSNITSINDNAFANCTSLTEVLFDIEYVNWISDTAFENCPNIEKVLIPNGYNEQIASLFPSSAIMYVEYYDGDEESRCRVMKDGEEYTFAGITYRYNGSYWGSSSVVSVLPDTCHIELLTNFGYNGTTVAWIEPYAFTNSEGISFVYIPGTISSADFGLNNPSENLRIVLGDGVRSIGYQRYPVKTVTIPESVTDMTEFSFEFNTVLKVYKDSYAHKFAEENGLLYYVIDGEEELLIINKDGFTYYITDGNAILVDYDDSVTTDVVVPESINGYPVTKIVGAFAYSQAKKIILPETIISIGRGAFEGCSLEEVTLPEGVVEIGDNAFEYSGIKNIELPNGIEYIGNKAFRLCYYLENISPIPNGTKLGEYCFESCSKLETVILPEDLTAIPMGLFQYCRKLKGITIPDTVTQIGYAAFGQCSALTEIKLPESLESIEAYAFSYCVGIENITVPQNVTSLYYAFSNCTGLKYVKLHDGITSIKYSFDNCVGLKTVLIPSDVTNIISSFASSTILLVEENSYAHTFAKANNALYFVLHKTENPEISYGTGIDGIVKYTDGTPAVGVNVDVLYADGTVKESVVTDENGAYSFTYAEVGRYSVRATDEKGNTATETVSVKRMNVFDVFLEGDTELILKKGYSISGTTSAPATVILMDTDGNVIASAETVDNVFTFDNVPNGTYVINVNGVTKEIHVFGAELDAEHFELIADCAAINGEALIMDRNHHHSKKIWVNVTLYNSQGIAVAQTKTDADGRYTFSNVVHDNYAIVAEAEEMRPDKDKHFDRPHKLTGYAYLEVKESIAYTADSIILCEENNDMAEISGKVTANGKTQDCEVTLSDVFRHEIAKYTTKKNGKYSFINILDGMYFISATTKNDGYGYAVILVLNGNVYGDTDIKVLKGSNIIYHEELMKQIPICNSREEALQYKDRIIAEKHFYDSLSKKEQKELSKEYTDRLDILCGYIADYEYISPEGVTVENGESVISGEELDSEEKVELVLSITKTEECEIDEKGIDSKEKHKQQKIKDNAKDKNVVEYYDITLTKNGEEITSVQKHTDTTGKLRITMEIPKEYRGHTHYSFIHEHNGTVTTLTDLDDNPNTVTFEVDKFSTFALAYTDTELTKDVEGFAATTVGTSLILDGSIGVKTYFDIDSTTADQITAVTVLRDSATDSDMRVTEAELIFDSEKELWYTVAYIAPKDADSYDVRHIFTLEGETYETEAVSINSYIEQFKAMAEGNADFEAALKLVVSLESYLKYADNYFGNAEPLADVVLDSEIEVEAGERSGELNGLEFYATSLVLEDKTTIRHYFRVTDESAVNTFKVGDTELVANRKQGSDLIYVDITDIPAHELDRAFTLTVSDTYSVKYSALNYVQSVISTQTDAKLVNLVKAIYNYYTEADAYHSALVPDDNESHPSEW